MQKLIAWMSTTTEMATINYVGEFPLQHAHHHSFPKYLYVGHSQPSPLLKITSPALKGTPNSHVWLPLSLQSWHAKWKIIRKQSCHVSDVFNLWSYRNCHCNGLWDKLCGPLGPHRERMYSVQTSDCCPFNPQPGVCPRLSRGTPVS